MPAWVDIRATWAEPMANTARTYDPQNPNAMGMGMGMKDVAGAMTSALNVLA